MDLESLIASQRSEEEGQLAVAWRPRQPALGIGRRPPPPAPREKLTRMLWHSFGACVGRRGLFTGGEYVRVSKWVGMRGGKPSRNKAVTRSAFRVRQRCPSTEVAGAVPLLLQERYILFIGVLSLLLKRLYRPCNPRRRPSLCGISWHAFHGILTVSAVVVLITPLFLLRARPAAVDRVTSFRRRTLQLNQTRGVYLQYIKV